MKTPKEQIAFLAHIAAADICNRFATHYMDVAFEAGPWGTKHLDDVTKIIEEKLITTHRDAMNRSVSICAGVSIRCRSIVKEKAIRQCVRALQEEVAQFTK